MLGGLVGLGFGGVMAEDSVPCPECGKPAVPRRWCKGATEYACSECGRNLPLGALIFTLKVNDPNYYVFFPADVDRMIIDSNEPVESPWEGVLMDGR
jgi:hypothetical protein